MTKNKNNIFRNIFVYGGLLIVVAWFVVMLSMNGHYLQSHILLIMLPVAIGNLLFSIGIAMKINGLLIKILLIIFNTIFFTYCTYWLLIIVLFGATEFRA